MDGRMVGLSTVGEYNTSNDRAPQWLMMPHRHADDDNNNHDDTEEENDNRDHEIKRNNYREARSCWRMK